MVGIGADGWNGLSTAAQQAVLNSEVLLGSTRQLALIPTEATAERIAWPSPLLPALPGLLDRYPHACVLASGDPMLFGIGATIARLVGPKGLHVLPHPSSVSLACARLGWPAEDVEVSSVVGRRIERLHPAVQPGRKLIVLSADGDTPAAIAGLLRERGFGDSRMTVLERLGAVEERRLTGTAAEWPHPETDPLNVVAIECCPTPSSAPLPRMPGLPDEVFEHDGQLTKREVRALALSALAPVPGHLLWDIGAGAGSIAIEWMRTHPACMAIAVECNPDRADRIGRNAAALGVPGLRTVRGTAPDALVELDPPDAVFLGGGVTGEGVLPACWDALRPGGRLVVNAVTVESEAVIVDWHGKVGGELTRISVNRAAPVGSFLAWRPMMPVTQWAVTK